MKKVIRTIISLVIVVAGIMALTACEKSLSTGKKPEVVSKETVSMKDESEKKETSANKETTKAGEETKDTQVVPAAPQDDANGQSDNGGGYEVVTEAEPETPAPAPEYIVYITVDAQECGGVLASATLTYSYQPSVYDALCACGVGINGSGYYVEAINGIREREHGPMSGWLYSVNGVTPMTSCGAYYLNSGDSVYWYYQVDE